MSNQSSDTFKIRLAPNRKFYVWGNGEAICLPNGNLRYSGPSARLGRFSPNGMLPR